MSASLESTPASDPSSMPLVSIIVPSFNQGEFIARTLDSILHQSYRPLEVIVVDGASTDNTVEVLKRYGEEYSELRLLSEPDEGIASAVNKGLSLAKGEIAAIQSSDDIYYRGAVAHAVDVLLENTHCSFVYGDSDSIDIEDRLLGRYRVPPFSWEGLFGISLCLPQQSIFFKMDIARRVGGWNPKYYGCDLDYWMRMLLKAPAVRTDFVFSAWRVHPEQRTRPSHFLKIWEGYWSMVRDSQELKEAPARIRRLAQASCHLMAFRFHPTGNLWALRWHALRAFFLFPGFARHLLPGAWRVLIPGYTSARNAYRKMRPASAKRSIGPRVSPGGARPVEW